MDDVKKWIDGINARTIVAGNIVNGVCITGNASNVVISNGKITIGGQVVDLSKAIEKEIPIEIKIEAGGRIENLRIESPFKTTIHGDVHGNVDSSGSIECGNVSGDLDASGSCRCGDVGGDVDASGSVTCGNVKGSVDASGSVRMSR